MRRSFAVIDDFLAPQEHLGLWHAFQGTAATDIQTWNRTYRMVETGVAGERRLHDGTAGEPGPPDLRLLREKLLALMSSEPPIAVESWSGFSQSAWTYRAGAGLEWHSDTGYAAGYIYYMHPKWKASWGGELLVADGDAVPFFTDRRSDDPCEDVPGISDRESICQRGGVFIYPRPNRLVLLEGGTWHCIKKVEAAAAIRASVSGFFFKAGSAL